MQGITVLDNIKSQQTVEAIYDLLYAKRLYSCDTIEDIILFTQKRQDYSNIGSDKIHSVVLKYILDNIFWINVCLYVNDDFRSCFDDAIAIEKALLQVNDQEYIDFRDDMTLDSESGAEMSPEIPINLSAFNEALARMLVNSIRSSKVNFDKSNMDDVYVELMDTIEGEECESVKYIINNMVYVINALNRNNVFHKYVNLVVDSVKAQLIK